MKLFLKNDLFHFRSLTLCKTTKSNKDIGGCQSIYKIKGYKILQEGWQSPNPSCIDFVPQLLWKCHVYF